MRRGGSPRQDLSRGAGPRGAGAAPRISAPPFRGGRGGWGPWRARFPPRPAGCFAPGLPRRVLPPPFLASILTPLWQTVAISVVGTVLGVVLGAILAVPATASIMFDPEARLRRLR